MFASSQNSQPGTLAKKNNMYKVKNYGDLNPEPFSDYWERIKNNSKDIPKCIWENWIHRHWDDFESEWGWIFESKAKFNLCKYNNSEIMSINHVDDWLSIMDSRGKLIFTDDYTQNTYLGQFMLNNGTTPRPIIVSKSNIQHPHGWQFTSPIQLIEGHRRLGFLRNMIKNSYNLIADYHYVWEIEINNS